MLKYYKRTVNLSEPIFDEIVNKIIESYPKSCVLWIDEIINDDLLARFEQKKELLHTLYEDVLELRLFHGTKEHCVEGISQEGLRCDLNVVSALGKGSYFATNAMTSVHYMGGTGKIVYMLYCDVLVGKKCIPGSKLEMGECFVDAIKNTNVYVVPEDDSIYVRYVIAFHKNPPL